MSRGSLGNAFSLVELSIVLVILGLLTGGILAGQSLIRAAELRSVVSEYQRYSTAATTFRDKYMALPGDMSNATRFWGDDNAACPDAAIPNGTPGTCNGNGDGKLGLATAANATGEMFQAWKQLALASLIEGTYSGLTGPNATAWPVDAIPGTNVPTSRLSNAGWGMLYFYSTSGDASTYAHNYGNMLVIGTRAANNVPVAALFKPEEAWNIDTKLDDGLPASGKIWVRDNGGFGNANACTTSASATDYTGTYKLTVSAIACGLWFPETF